VGQDEDPLSLMRGAHGCRRKSEPFRIEPERGQLTEDVLEGTSSVSSEKASWVLEKAPSGLNLPNDAERIGPEPAVIGSGEPSPCCADGLAGHAANDEVHAATPRLAIEGSGI
jgi:hypothetical protein